MLKNILKLEGAQKLTATEQKSISGGKPYTPVCGGTGFEASEESCLAKGQSYVWEIATMCCYNLPE